MHSRWGIVLEASFLKNKMWKGGGEIFANCSADEESVESTRRTLFLKIPAIMIRDHPQNTTTL